jgi:nitrite reductase (NADH) small subunit/3-phenylpropionate/trans-cinnamate dioxygenase ferredoxin subunit
MGEFRTVCRVGDLKEGEGKTVTVGGKLVAVFRCGDRYHAIDDMCPHMGASLGDGYAEDGIVTCPWHAWRFRLSDGAWADNPRIKIPCFQVRVEGDEVQVEVPAPGEGKTS